MAADGVDVGDWTCSRTMSVSVSNMHRACVLDCMGISLRLLGYVECRTAMGRDDLRIDAALVMRRHATARTVDQQRRNIFITEHFGTAERVDMERVGRRIAGRPPSGLKFFRLTEFHPERWSTASWL